jgi:hypothetical protein
MKKLALLLVLLITVACNTAEPETVSEAADSAPTATESPTSIPATDIPPPTAVPPTDTPAPTNTPEPTNTAVPTATSSPTPVPTATPSPTPIPPDPIIINTEETAADGCPLIELNPETWNPLTAAYNGGSDPFFQFHTQNESFFFNLELYTVYGASWTGQLGSFVPNCNGNGLCIYILPDNTNPYWATAGEISINALEQVDGTLTFPVEIIMSNLTMNPVPGSQSTGCYNIAEMSVIIEE